MTIYLTKPLLLLALAFIFYHTSGGGQRTVSERWLFAGLLFSCAGDILLMFSAGPSGTLFFLSGLNSFLLAHICYILSFYQYPPRGCHPDIFAVFLFYGIAIALVVYLWPVLDLAMKIALSMYAFIISTMGIFAHSMYQKLSYRAASFLLLGAISFIFSDSIIALDKFRPELVIWMPRITIMSSYILAQFLIVAGALLASKEMAYLDTSRITSSPNR